MKEKMILWAMQLFMTRLDGEDLKKWIDIGLDLVEDKVAASPTNTDDMIVLPICRILREALSVPDNDEVEDETEDK